jgi:4-diphosphocytidyl-2-C-methyl-D-erythritol kinase
MLIRSIQKGDAKSLTGLLNNSLELVLNKRVTEIKKIKDELVIHGAKAALMSGSGSTVFGLFDSKSKAELAARKLRKENKAWQVFIASSF